MAAVTGAELRIGFVVDGMAGPASGTWTRFVALVNGLARANVRVHALGSDALRPALLELPIETVNIVARDSKVARLALRKREVRRFVQEFSLSVVHLETPPFPRTSGVISIGSVHDLRFFSQGLRSIRTTEGLYQRFLLKRQVHNLTRIATLGPWGSQEVQSVLKVARDKILEIPPIVMPAAHNIQGDLAGMLKTPRATSFALVLGHLEQRKNVRTVIEATTLDTWPKDLAVVVAGSNAGEGDELRKLAQSSKRAIHFLGQVSDCDKWQLLREAEVVLVPSLVEGFGIVAVEAPLAGTVALVSDRTALPFVAGDKRAVVPALDPRAWAETVSLLLTNKEEHLSVLGNQKRAAAEFQENVVIEKLLAAYTAFERNKPSAPNARA